MVDPSLQKDLAILPSVIFAGFYKDFVVNFLTYVFNPSIIVVEFETV